MKTTVEIPSKIDERLEEAIDEGYYSSKAEAIRNGLRLILQDLNDKNGDS